MEKIVTIRISAKLKREAEKAAREDGRSLSNWILRLIQEKIEPKEEK